MTEQVSPGRLREAKCSATYWVGLTSWSPNFLKPVRYTLSNMQEYNNIKLFEIIELIS